MHSPGPRHLDSPRPDPSTTINTNKPQPVIIIIIKGHSLTNKPQPVCTLKPHPPAQLPHTYKPRILPHLIADNGRLALISGTALHGTPCYCQLGWVVHRLPDIQAQVVLGNTPNNYYQVRCSPTNCTTVDLQWRCIM